MRNSKLAQTHSGLSINALFHTGTAVFWYSHTGMATRWTVMDTYSCSIVFWKKQYLRGFTPFFFFLSETLHGFALKDANCFLWCVAPLCPADGIWSFYVLRWNCSLRKDLVFEGIGCWSHLLYFPLKARPY